MSNTVTKENDNEIAAKLIDRSIANYEDDALSIVGSNAFSSCTSLTSVSLPVATSISSNAFNSCGKLETLVLSNTSTVATLSNINALTNTPTTQRIYVPDDLVDDYKSATNWSTYADRIYPMSEKPMEYGVEWDFTQDSPALTRTGDAASFTDPVPATSVSTTGSSPFDTIAPWKDMKMYNVINGQLSYSQDDEGFSITDYDTVVYIPTFYYKAEKGESVWNWSISPTEQSGYTLHPGSGKYVGRYHTSGDDTAVFSKSGVAPLASKTRANFREYSANKGEGWSQISLEVWSALQLLYLVEFANFNSQAVLGYGRSNGSVTNTGGTDGAAYHTIKNSANTDSNMYRYVENPFSNLYTFVDGLVTSARKAYVGAAQDTITDLTDTGITLPTSNFITGFGYSEDAPWAFIPNAASGGSATTKVTDRVYSGTGVRVLYVGGYYNRNDYYGFFCFDAYYAATSSGTVVGSRLLYKPVQGV